MNQDKKVIEGRIISSKRDFWIVDDGDKEYTARLTGKMRDTEEYPVVGDFVKATVDAYGSVSIMQVLPRKSFLVRPDRRGHADGYVKTMKEQAIISNYDYAFIIASMNHNFSINRIARYAAVTTAGGGIPVVVLTKADLVECAEEYVEKVKAINPTLEVVAVSSYTGDGMEQLRKYFTEGITIALLGSSGVGKSTLINHLAGKDIMQVSEIRESDSKGRHTTTHRQMVEIEGAWVIDTPGMRELGMCDVEEAVDSTFDDITLLANSCMFSNCRHDTEPGCAVKQALESGELSERRWQMYCNLHRESTWAKGLRKGKRNP